MTRPSDTMSDFSGTVEFDLESVNWETVCKLVIDENAKLREELAKWERLAAGIDLPEYPVTQFKPKDLERENAKLRELVRDMWNGMCGYGHDCRSCEHYELSAGQRFVGECEFFTRMRELGIEVP